jgi:peroxiredoxin
VSWLGELAKHADELGKRDIAVVAIASDAVEDMKDLQTKLVGVTLYTDPGVKVADGWGLKVAGAEHPQPGTFVVKKDGMVTWRKLADGKTDWPSYDELSGAL